MATSGVEESDESSFKNSLDLNISKLSDECRSLLYESSANIQEAQLLTKALVKCQSCLRTLAKSEEKLSKEIVTILLKDFCQAIMDKTFVEENRLVEKDFEENDSRQQIVTILDYLSLPEKLGNHYIHVNNSEGDDLKLESLLSLEVWECLCWRRGALLYMYCHTVYNDSARWKAGTTDFYKDSKLGVEYLQKMLNVRSCLADDKSTTESNDSTTIELINKGIFSDTHVLALMYAGELCFWHWKTLQLPHLTAQEEIPNSRSDIMHQCKHFLSKYISTVQGPLQGMGWDTIKAEQYLDELNKDITQTT